MPDDIRRLAVSDDSITDIIYHRNPFMEFQGKVTVVFRSATDAVEFITQRYGKFLSGHKLSMNMVWKDYFFSLESVFFNENQCRLN